MAEAARSIESMLPPRQTAAPRRADAGLDRSGREFATLVEEPRPERTPRERAEPDHRRDARRPDEARHERRIREEPPVDRAAARSEERSGSRSAKAEPATEDARTDQPPRGNTATTGEQPAAGEPAAPTTAEGQATDTVPTPTILALVTGLPVQTAVGAGKDLLSAGQEAPAVNAAAILPGMQAQVQGAIAPEAGGQTARPTVAATSSLSQPPGSAAWSPLNGTDAATGETQPAAGKPAGGNSVDGSPPAEVPRQPAELPLQAPQAQAVTRPAFAEAGLLVQMESPSVASPDALSPMSAKESTASQLPAAEARRASEPAVPLPALALEIGMRAVRGAREFSIALDPEELGRIEVKLRIDDEGAVKADVRVERVETLQLLQRDARTLERAFEQAGLRNGGDMLQFSLQGGDRQAGGQERPTGSASARGLPELDEAIPQELLARHVRPTAGALDIRI